MRRAFSRMIFTTWPQQLFTRHQARRKTSTAHDMPFGRRLRCEPLEDRRMLTIFSVNSLADVVADDGDITLREALEAANTNAAVHDAAAGSDTETDVITFAPELFTDGVDPTPGKITLDGQQLDVLDDLEIQGPGDELLTIDADQRSRVIYVAEEVSLAIDGLTITGGFVEDLDPDDDDVALGGGIYAPGIISIAYSTIADNIVSGDKAMGGGIYAPKHLMISDSSIENNSAVGYRTRGGGIACGATVIWGSPSIVLQSTISNSIISGNATLGGGGEGGGICVLNSTHIENSVIVGNYTARESVTSLNLDDADVISNLSGAGGGIYIDSAAYGSGVTNTLLTNNASRYGGAFYTKDSFSVKSSTITENFALCGGGIYSLSTSAVYIHDSTIVYNSATQYGGGIAYTPFQGCFAGSINSIIALNTAYSVPDISPVLIDGGPRAYCHHDLIGVWTGDLQGISNSIMLGTFGIPLDPMLTAVTDADGMVRYYRPQLGSPVLDAGGWNDISGENVTDMLGNPRVYNGQSDIGAVELTAESQLSVSATKSLEVVEGESAVVFASLTSAPSEPVSVTIVKENGSPTLSCDTTTLVFDETNWNVKQSITISAAIDADFDDERATFALMAEGMDTIRIWSSSLDIDHQTYIVNDLGDSIAADGVLTLREALEAANSNTAVGDAPAGGSGSADVIYFDPSLAGESIVLSGSELTITDDVRIQGLGANLLSIDADGLSRVFHVSNFADATIADLTITGGRAIEVDGVSRGGGIYSDQATLTIINSTIAGNVATGSGSGLYLSKSIATIINSAIVGNSRDDGNAIWVGWSTLILESTTVAGSSSSSLYDAIAFHPASTMWMTNSIIPTMEDFDAAYMSEVGFNLIGSDPMFVRNPSDGGDGWGDNPDTPDIDESANDDYGDLRLRDGSPAIDEGSNDLAVDAHGQPLETDLAGHSRIENGTVDIGAYEYFEQSGLPGDANLDGTVNDADAELLADNWQKQSYATWAEGDFNGDGRVNEIDATLLATNWKKTLAPPRLPGDANLDGAVNDADAESLAANWQKQSDATWSEGDFNGDGRVNEIDATILAANWKKTVDVPVASSSPETTPVAITPVAPVVQPPAILPGDANLDGTVSDADVALLAANWQKQSAATWSEGDFNGDGKVDDADATILALHWMMFVDEQEQDDKEVIA